MGVASEAVIVVVAGLLTVSSVTLNVPVPEDSAAFEGSIAFVSLEVI